ncbi:uncharacterized protein LOC134291147 isoform X1 [Aedes albopictus]|uniref:Uncharacterized protein n=1 Tax=Aedes albopictus TaxID=7160 RepID=A0ABM1YTG9_AEDAL
MPLDTPQPSLEKARSGDSVIHSRPESDRFPRLTSQSYFGMEVLSTRSSKTARLALRLQQLEEERAIELRKIEVERRALALEREAMHAKYRLLQRQASNKAVRCNKVGANDNKPSTDGTMQNAHERAAVLSKKRTISAIQSDNQSNQSMQPSCTESADRSQLPSGIQQQNIGAFPGAILEEQSEIIECNDERMEEEKILAPCHISERSVTFRESLDANAELYHTQTYSSLHLYSSTDQGLPINASRRNMQHSIAKSSGDPRPRYNNAKNRAEVDPQLLEREKTEQHARVKWSGFQLDPDTGQRMRETLESSKGVTSNDKQQLLAGVSGAIAAPPLEKHRHANETNSEQPHYSTCSMNSKDQLISLSATSVTPTFACNTNFLLDRCSGLNQYIFLPLGNIKAEASHQLTQTKMATLKHYRGQYKSSPTQSVIHRSCLYYHRVRNQSPMFVLECIQQSSSRFVITKPRTKLCDDRRIDEKRLNDRKMQHNFVNERSTMGNPKLSKTEYHPVVNIQGLVRERKKAKGCIDCIDVQIDPDTGQKMNGPLEAPTDFSSNDKDQLFTGVPQAISNSPLNSHRQEIETEPQFPPKSTYHSTDFTGSRFSIDQGYRLNRCFRSNVFETTQSSVLDQLALAETAGSSFRRRDERETFPLRRCMYRSSSWYRHCKYHNRRYSCWKACSKTRINSQLPYRERSVDSSENDIKEDVASQFMTIFVLVVAARRSRLIFEVLFPVDFSGVCPRLDMVEHPVSYVSCICASPVKLVTTVKVKVRFKLFSHDPYR